MCEGREVELCTYPSAAVKNSPLNIYRDALILPAIAANLYVPPIPGVNPKDISGNPIFAFSAAKTVSIDKTNSRPPPNATPFTPQIICFFTLINASANSPTIGCVISVS